MSTQPMRVAIYTLTRDRLDYTKRSFESLWDKAGYPFDHYVIDNGSEDGTRTWLEEHFGRFTHVEFLSENLGISAGSNLALDAMKLQKYDLIAKMDNDCEVLSNNLVLHMVELFGGTSRKLLVSPAVKGINRQPKRAYTISAGGFEIGRTGIVGGLCHWMRGELYQQYRYPLDLPKAWGQDDALCHWAYCQSIDIGYVESLQVAHMDGTDNQALKYPDYFTRKWQEEKIG